MSEVGRNAGACSAGSCLVEAGMPPWFHKLSRFLRLISNAANAVQSMKAAGSAEGKSLCAVTAATCHSRQCSVLFKRLISAVLYQQDILHMVFLMNFALLVVVGFDSLG
jgi:hypothetical protein